MAFGPPKYMPGQVQSQSLAPMGFDETMAMLNATAPKSAIQAPKDRGMFGRFKGFNPMRFDPDKGVGEGNRLYALGAMLAGMGTGDPALTANLLEPKLQQNRERVQARDEEAKRRAMAVQLGVNPELFAMDPTLALGERRDQRNFDRSALESDRNYGLQQDQFGLQKDQFGWQKETDARDFGRGVLESDRTHGLQQDQFGLEKNKFGWQQGTDARDFNEGVRQFDLTYGLSREKAAADAASGKTREMRQDSKGMWRYVDDGSPVFPDDKPVNKPLIGAESMGRVAAGLPNMRAAVDDLKSVLGITSTNGQYSANPESYRPGQDWGALTLEKIPLVGDVMARGAGGEDYQKFDNAYSSFEAAALPIMSGAAVTESEATRALKALRVRVGDSDEAVARKMANMERMVMGLEAAARGDAAALQAIVGEVNSQVSMRGNGLPPGFVVIE